MSSPTRRSWRDRALALPFVLTVGLAPAGCPSSTPTPRPPPPEETAKPPNDGPRAAVVRRADGSCWEELSITCPEGATCNPPPPRPIDCPADPGRIDRDFMKK